MKSIKDVWEVSKTKSAAEIEEILQNNGCWLDVRFSLKSKDFEKYICEDLRFPGSDTFALVDVAIRDAKPGILKYWVQPISTDLAKSFALNFTKMEKSRFVKIA